MHTRLLALSLLAPALGALLPAEAGSQGSESRGVAVVAPDDRVDAFRFEIAVRVPPPLDFDPAADVTLNAEPIPVERGRGSLYETHFGPGFPLRDENVLVVQARDSRGRLRRAEHRFAYLPPKARARRIEDPADLASGPLAHGRTGDYLLANDVARFVIQDGGQRDMYGVGVFGGNLIDAELVGRPGLESFLEFQPMANIESVFNAQRITIENDGQDGTAAVIRACGPDDLLDFANPSSFVVDAGLPAPEAIDDVDHDIEGCTFYRLEPGRPWVEVETRVENLESEDLPLAVGDWVNSGGELDTWAKPFHEVSPPSLSYGGLGEPLLGEVSSLAFVGRGEASGIDYGYVPVEVPSLPDERTTFFTTSGFNVVLHNHNMLTALLGFEPPFVVPAGGHLSFTRFFGVGNGSGSNTIDMENAVRGVAAGAIEGCVTVGGAPLGGSRVSVGSVEDGRIARFYTTFVTKEGPCPNYAGTVPAGSYGAVAGRDGALYGDGAPHPPVTTVAIEAGATAAGVDFELPAGGRLEVDVVDGSGRPVPARVTVVGFDPSPEPLIDGPGFPGLGGSTLAELSDPGDRLPFGIVGFAYAGADGRAELGVEPGDYQLFVSRGTEYSLFQEPLSIQSGATTRKSARIFRVLDTEGFVSSDFHVHGIRSFDSRVNDTDRVLQFAGEGVENAVMTDHHVHTDLLPAIRKLGMDAFLTSTVGEEITTFDYGHFNGYPFTIDPSRPSGGSTDWAQPAPPGCEFPAPLDADCPGSALNATPSEILELARTSPEATPDTTVQINHIDSHFEPLQIDTSLAGLIADALDAKERADRRLPDGPNLFQHFPALELWNGNNRDHALREFLDERIGIWFNHLNKGLPTTFIADTDSHRFTSLRTAGARTWTASSTDDPASIAPGEVARAVDAGRAVGGQGVYVQARLRALDGSGGEADLTLGGQTLVTSANGAVELEVRAQAPLWAPFDSIEIYANSSTEPVNPEAPYLFRAAPQEGEVVTLREGDCLPDTTGDGDFDVQVVPAGSPDPSPEAARLEARVTVSYPALAQDTWFVVVVRGSDDKCAPMFPVYPDDLAERANEYLEDLLDGNEGEDGVLALGATNALFADVDGIPGFQPKNP